MNAVNVTQFLRTKDVMLLPNNPWLLGCIDWYKSHDELASTYGSLPEYVYVQWSLADLKHVHQGTLPANCKDGTITLNGKHAVQVNWIRDIGQSSYSQLKSIQNTTDDNANVSAEENKKENWEPSPKRCLMMEITDGITVLKTMEYSPITKIGEPFHPGCKMILIGPIECRNGILLLQNNNISLIGGEVDDLYEINSKENQLCRCLNLPVNVASTDTASRPTNDPIANDYPSENITPNITQERRRNAPVTSSFPPATVVNNRLDEFDDDLIEELPDSTTMEVEHNIHDASLMSDDDIFLQLPDDVLDNANVDPPEPELSPQFGRTPSITNKQINSTRETTSGPSNIQSSVQPSVMKKSRLFPSLEDLRTDKSENDSGTPTSFTALTEAPSNTRHVASISKPSCSKNIGLPLHKGQTKFESDEVDTINNSLDTSINEMFGFKNVHINEMNKQSDKQRTEENNVLASHVGTREEYIQLNTENYPITKTCEIEVKSITKLKIRNKEWCCTALVLINSQQVDVVFSDKVLEKIFKIPASEVEVLRGEMSNNPSLKKTVNDILKDGQSKLKTLKGLATVEYSSEDCVPLIVSINPST